MVERAFQWAEQNKKTRVNAVHGEPEAFLLISDTVAFTSTDIEENEQSGAIECEDLDFNFLGWYPPIAIHFLRPRDINYFSGYMSLGSFPKLLGSFPKLVYKKIGFHNGFAQITSRRIHRAPSWTPT